jgi:5,6-dimethylbenzimidazole synthase
MTVPAANPPAAKDAEAAPDFDTAFRAKFRELLLWRRDVRRFRRDPVPEAVLAPLLDLVALAPSVGLSQPSRFVLVNDTERRAAVRENFRAANAEAFSAQAPERQRLYASLKLSGLEAAPVQIAVFTERATEQGHGLGRRTMPEMAEYSTVAAIHTLWLAARAAGVGLGWVSILDPRPLARLLDVPEEWIFVAYLCLGYPEAETVVPELEAKGWEHRRPAERFILNR